MAIFTKQKKQRTQISNPGRKELAYLCPFIKNKRDS